MTNWHEPTQLNPWIKGLFSTLHGLIVVVVMIVLVSEWRLKWCETLVGSYLAAINDSRPESGTIWETGDRNDSARSYLTTLIQGRKEATRYARETTSFMELASGILPGQWTHISKRHFKRLYLALPEPAAVDLLPPLELAWLFGGTRVDRIFCEGKESGLEIYFLTGENSVVRQISLTREKLSKLDEADPLFQGSLADIPDFDGNIYPAKLFFQTISSLPRETISQLVIHPERLIREKGRLRRVGIWKQETSGYLQVGFEFTTDSGPLVIFTRGQKWAVEQLNRRLMRRLQ